MKKKTITALKRLEKLTPTGKAVAFTAATVYLPFGVIHELLKKPKYQLKPKRRRRR